MDMILSGEKLEQADYFRYLGADVYETDRMKGKK